MYIDNMKPTQLIKKVIAALAAFVLAASLLAGCGDEKNSPTKATTANESAASTSTGETKPGKPPVDADGWPKDKVSALIPKPGFGSVIDASQPKAGVSVISLKAVSEKNFEQYISLLKKEGFNLLIQETAGESIKNFHAGNKGGAFVDLVYSIKNKIAVITVKSGS